MIISLHTTVPLLCNKIPSSGNLPDKKMFPPSVTLIFAAFINPKEFKLLTFTSSP